MIKTSKSTVPEPVFPKSYEFIENPEMVVLFFNRFRAILKTSQFGFPLM